MISKKNFLVVFLIPLFFLSQLFSLNYAQAATYTFSQNDWSSGSSLSSAIHDENQTGWNKFSSQENLDFSNGLKINPTNGNFSKTTFEDFSNGTKTQTSVSGAGVDGSVILGTSNAVKPKVVQSTNSTFSFDSYALKSDGTVWAWGSNGNGQIGDNTTTQRLYPVQVLGPGGVGYLSNVVDIAASSFSAYALKSDGTVWAWGDNGSGQLGDNTTTKKYTPVQVKDSAGTGFLSNIIDIAASGANTVFALQSDGTVWSWGAGASGQLGDGTTVTSRKLPAKVKDPSGTGFLSNVVSIAGGHGASAYALLSNGEVVSWGKNDVGQLGNNSTIQSALPVYVVDSNGTGRLSGVTMLSGGGLSAYALKSDGTVWAWGDNTKGQLGNGTTVQSLIPVKVVQASDPSGFLSNVISLAGGYMSAFALKNDGTVWAWGENDYRGQLGDNTAIQRETPVQVNGLDGVGYLSGITSISSGYGFAFAVQDDGTVWGWGLNANKQIGDGVTQHRDTPVKVLDNVSPNIFNMGSNTYYTSGVYASEVLDISSFVNLKILNFETTLNSQNITVDIRAGNTSSPDGTWTSWLTNISNGGDISSLGNKRYVQYRVNLSTSNNQITPKFNSISISYDSYTQGNLVSSVYDSFDATNVLSKISWIATDADINNTVKFQIRTSSDGVNWSSWCGYADCSGLSYFDSSSNNLLLTAGHPLRSGGNDEYIQYKVFLNSQGVKTPVLTTVNLSYLINASPSFDVNYPNVSSGGVEAYQVSDPASPYFGDVYISYKVLDQDSSTGITNPNKIKPSFEYSLDNGSSWNVINESALRANDTSLKTVLENSYTKHDAVWDVDASSSNLKIRVIVNDNELSNNTKIAESQNFTVDKTGPYVSSSMFNFDAGVAGVLNSATVNMIKPGDASSVYYFVSDDETKESNPKNTGWVLMTDNISIPWTFDKDIEQKSLKFKFKDTFGNESQEVVISTLDPRPSNSFMVQDISNLSSNPASYSLYLSWQPLDSMDNFNYYLLESSTSTDGINYSEFQRIPASALSEYRDNSFVYKNLDPNTFYKIRISVNDSDGNNTVRVESPFVTKPDGVQNYGEGGGGSIASSSIVENVIPEQLLNGNVNVSYKIKDSSVDKKTNAYYDARLFYNIGLTLSSNPFSENSIKLSSTTNLPDSGFIQVNNEVLKYESNNKETGVLSSLTRGTWPIAGRYTRQNNVFLSGTPVWIMAKNTTPSVVDKTNIKDGLDLSLLWNTFEDIALFGKDYKNVGIRVLVHDNQDASNGPLSSQNDYSETGILNNLSLSEPVVYFEKSTESKNETENTFEINILLSKLYPKDISVDYTVSGSATTGVDYVLSSGKATIGAGSSSVKITGSVVDDILIEGDETIILTLENPVNAVLNSSNKFTYTILNNESIPSVSFSNNESSGLESVSSVSVPINISSASSLDTSVEVEISGTATEGEDYNISTKNITFEAGQTSSNIVLTIFEDTDVEDSESIIMTIKNPSGLVLGQEIVYSYSILNNDEVASVSFENASSSVLENAGSLNIPIVIPFVLDKDVTVDYSLSGGTATAGEDFVFVSGKALIKKGETTTSININIIDDILKESDENLSIILSNPVNAILGQNSIYSYTILDNENLNEVSFVSIESSGLENQNKVNTGIVLSGVSQLPVSFDYTVSGSSLYNQDHNLDSGSITINPGKTSASILFEITDDLIKENEETLIITLSNIVNASLVEGKNIFTYKILDNDSFPKINFSETSKNNSEDISTYDIPLVLDNPSSIDLSFDYVVSGTATSDLDFELANGSINIPAGSTSSKIVLNIKEDSLKEIEETIIVTITNPNNVILGLNNVFTYTILDNDSYPFVEFSQVNVSNTENVTSVKIPISISEVSGVDINLAYSVAGSASSEADYILSSGELILLAGSLGAEINLEIVDDTKKESDENIVVTINNIQNATLGQNKIFTYTILDNDTYPTINFSSTVSQGKEDINSANVLVTISDIYPEDISFDFAVMGGSAEGSTIDYDISSRNGVIKAGTTNTSIPIVIFDDALFEENESILLKITNAKNAILGSSITHAYTILDNEIAVTDISGSSIKSTSARIVWTTADYTDSLIEYGEISPGTEGAYSRSKQSLEKVLNHSVYLDDLTPDTKYYFKTTSTNLKGETTVSESSFKTTQGPIISTVSSGGESDTSVIVTWVTNIPATSTVIYSSSPNMESPVTTSSPELTLSHSVKIENLLPDKLYYYVVNSSDENGNVGESANGGSYYMFGTGADSTAPIISDVSVPVKTASQVVVTWNTNEPADGKIKYGTSQGEYSESSEFIYKLTNAHLISISNLEESSQYYYVIESSDEKGNKTISNEYVFETPEKEKVIINKGGGGIVGVAQELYDLILAENQAYKARFSTLSSTAPVISNIEISDITPFSAVISFNTDKDTISFVKYGKDKGYGQVSGNGEWSQSHRVRLSGLALGTEYQFKISAIDKSNNTGESDNQAFTTKFMSEDISELQKIDNVEQFQKEIESTIESILPSLAPPFIGKPEVTEITENSAKIKFKTNIKSFPIIGFASESSYDSSKENPYDNEVSDSSEKRTAHEIVVKGLRPNTKYHYIVKAFSLPQVVGKSEDFTFTTSASKIQASVLDIKKDSFTVVWYTDEPASSIVEYKNIKTGRSAKLVEDEKKTSHSVKIENLEPGSSYEITVSGINAKGNILESSSVINAKTSVDKKAPEITNVKVDNALVSGRTDKVQTIVSWQTDEPSTSTVYYQEGAGSNNGELANKQEDKELTKNHVVILTVLKPGTVYRFTVSSTDEVGNTAKPPVRTIITPKKTESIVDVIFKNFDDTFNFINNVR